MSIGNKFVYGILTKIKYYKNNRFARGNYVSKSSYLEGNNFLDTNAKLFDSEMGFASYIGRNTELYKCKVGKFTCIGPNVSIVFGNHPTKEYASIHPAFFSIKKQSGFSFVETQLYNEETYVDQNKKWYVEIGNDVWIGSNVLIMAGVKIADGAIIGAGSVVVKDIAPYSISVGNPAHVIRNRFNGNQIEKLLQLRWWNKDYSWLKSHARHFKNVDALLNAVDFRGEQAEHKMKE